MRNQLPNHHPITKSPNLAALLFFALVACALTWPLVTVFGFLAQPGTHFFLKPNVTKIAAAKYGYPLAYESRPSWRIYEGVLEFAATVRRDLRDLRPRDMIDLQSFMWVQGAAEYQP